MREKNMLDQIDRYFETKKDSEAKMYFFLMFMLVAAFVYLFMFQPAEDYYNQKQNALDDITRQLGEVDNYLASVSSPEGDRNFKINQKTQVLNQEKNNLEILVASNNYFNKKLIEISYLTYNEQNWAKFLDYLTASARENDVKVYSLYSDIESSGTEKVRKVLDIEINIEGGFNNILKYINSIEESEMVVDVSGLDINSTDNKIGGKIKVSVWGMKYQ